MDTATVTHPPNSDTREVRALALYRTRGAEIVRTGPHIYDVPSCTGARSYRVEYGGEVESCSCPDARRHPELSCKHVLAVAVKRAKRRGATARRLAALEDRYAHELMPEEERLELRDTVARLRRRLGL